MGLIKKALPKVWAFIKKLWKGYVDLMRKLGKKLREKDWSKVKAKLSDMGRKNAIATGFSGGGTGFSSPFVDSLTGGSPRTTILTPPTRQGKKKRKKKRSRGKQTIIINI